MSLRTLFCFVAVPFLVAAGQAGPRAVNPIAAGAWYPAESAALRKSVEDYVARADAAPVDGRVIACILPHAPYPTAGPVAAPVLKQLKPGAYDRVIVLAPAHFSSFRGCSIPSAQAWRTPLGFVPMDGPAIRTLDRSTLIEVRSLHYRPNAERRQLHERETTIEVVLPYLQVQLGSFTLIPLLVGDFKDYRGGIDGYALSSVAQSLREFIDDRTLVVVSSDFTHFGNNFSYRPFRENIIQSIEALDHNAFDLIVQRNIPAFEEYLTFTENTICGKNAILILLRLLPQNAQAKLMSYEMTGKRTGDTSTSVSYAGFVFTTPEPAKADAP